MNALSKKVNGFLSSVDIDPSEVGPRLGAGFQHAVFERKRMTAESIDEVLKLPHLGMIRDSLRRGLYRLITPTPIQAQEEAEMAREYFGAYVWQTDVHRSEDIEHKDLYAITQPRLERFETLTPAHIELHPELDEQLEEICEANRQLHAKHKLYADLMGVRMSMSPYLQNIVVLDDDHDEGHMRLTLPDLSFFSAPGRNEPDAPVKSLYQKSLLPIHKFNMRRFGHEFVA